MSAVCSSPANTKMSGDFSHPSLEFVRLSSVWGKELTGFFEDLKCSGDDVFFSPHAVDADSIEKIAGYDGKDLYYLLIEQNQILGYGLLRGWDEGYAVPSLGIAIHPSARGQRLGKVLMDMLHVLAARRGADRVRLRVRTNNEKALNLYKMLGYVFELDANQPDFLVGFKSLE